jgi:hypothetical protein
MLFRFIALRKTDHREGTQNRRRAHGTTSRHCFLSSAMRHSAKEKKIRVDHLLMTIDN